MSSDEHAQLSELPAQRWAIATSASKRLGLARWKGAGISIPTVIVAAEHVEFGKPHPEPYLAAARDLGISITECVVFEGSPSGGEAGRAAGATVIAVGAQAWPIEPALRVETLAEVSITPTTDDQIAIRLTTS